MRSMLFLSFITLLVMNFSQTAIASPQKNFIVFGDSLSDAGANTKTHDHGNNTWSRVHSKQGAPIINIDPTTNTHPLWSNWVAKKFGGTIYPYRIIYNLGLTTFNHNISYAYAGAETGDNYINDISGKAIPPYVSTICQTPGQITESLACVPGVLKQVDLYLSEVKHPSINTVFIIWAGGNDIFNNITKSINTLNKKNLKNISIDLFNIIKSSLSLQEKQPTKGFIPKLSYPVRNLIKARNRLIEAGANPENIYVINLPDLSTVPAGINLIKNKVPALLLKGISLQFNKTLKIAMCENPFSNKNLPRKNILSIYDLLHQVAKNPKKYKVTHLQSSCIADNKQPLCTGYIFFDSKHPTSATGKIIAKWVTNKLQ